MTTNADVIALVDVARLRTYLDSVLPLGDELQLEVLSGGRSNLTYLLRSGGDQYVLRRRPLGEVPTGAHDMAREFRVQSALQGTSLPLARMYGYCADEAVMG